MAMDSPVQEDDDDSTDDELAAHGDMLGGHYYEVDPQDDTKLVSMAFCCAHCKCSEEDKLQYEVRSFNVLAECSSTCFLL